MSVDSVLIKYIRDQTNAGYEENLIKDVLFKQGWMEEEIEEAFSVALSDKQTKRENPPQDYQERPRAAQSSFQDTNPKTKPSVLSDDFVKSKVEQIEKRKAPSGGFGLAAILGLAGGLVILVNAILVFMDFGDIISIVLPSFSITLLTMLNISMSAFEIFLLNTIVGIGIIACSLLGDKPGKSMLAGIVIISLGIMSLIVGNGFMIGALIAMIGGALLASKS